MPPRKNLHIIKDQDGLEAYRMAERVSEGLDRILLIQNAVGLSPRLKEPAYNLVGDPGDTDPSSGPEWIDHPRMLEMILTADSVKVW